LEKRIEERKGEFPPEYVLVKNDIWSETATENELDQEALLSCRKKQRPYGQSANSYEGNRGEKRRAKGGLIMQVAGNIA